MKTATITIGKTACKIASLCPLIAAEATKQAGLSDRASRTVLAVCWFGDCLTPGFPTISAVALTVAHCFDSKCGIKAVKELASKIK